MIFLVLRNGIAFMLSDHGTTTASQKTAFQKKALAARMKLVHRQNGYLVLFVRVVYFVTWKRHFCFKKVARATSAD
jgi:hypothetical protein